MKLSKKIMIKKQQKRYQKPFLKQLLKKTLIPTKKIQIWKKTCVHKVINVIQLLVQSDGETYCCC